MRLKKLHKRVNCVKRCFLMRARIGVYVEPPSRGRQLHHCYNDDGEIRPTCMSIVKYSSTMELARLIAGQRFWQGKTISKFW